MIHCFVFPTGEFVMRVFLTSNEAGGFADWVECEKGTTVGDFICDNCRNSSVSNLFIRVNSNSVDSSYLLNEGDRVTATPKKFDGGM